MKAIECDGAARIGGPKKFCDERGPIGGLDE